mgnify:CR=1 FL=1
MTNPKPVRKQQVKRKPLPEPAPETVRPEAKNYAPVMKITPSGQKVVPPGTKVTTVGLGNLTVETNGKRDYTSI